MDDPSKFRCTLCNKTRSLSTSGQSAISIHASGDKHKEIVVKILNFFNKSKKKSAYKKLNSKQLTLDGKINNSEVTYTEIKWVLKRIVSEFGMNSVGDACDDSKKCFQTVT